MSLSDSLYRAGGGSASERRKYEAKQAGESIEEKKRQFFNRDQAALAEEEEQQNVAVDDFARFRREVLSTISLIPELLHRTEELEKRLAEVSGEEAGATDQETYPDMVQTVLSAPTPALQSAPSEFKDFELIPYSQTKVMFYNKTDPVAGLRGRVYDGEDSKTEIYEGTTFAGWFDASPQTPVTITSSTGYFWVDYDQSVGSWTMNQGSAIPAYSSGHLIMPICRIGWDSTNSVIDATDIEIYHVGAICFPRKLALSQEHNSDFLGADYNDGILRLAALGTKPTGTGATTGLHWDHAVATDDFVTLYHSDTSNDGGQTCSSLEAVTTLTLDDFGHVTGSAKTDLTDSVEDVIDNYLPEISVPVPISCELQSENNYLVWVDDVQHDTTNHWLQIRTRTDTYSVYTLTLGEDTFDFISITNQGEAGDWKTITGGTLAPHSGEHP